MVKIGEGVQGPGLGVPWHDLDEQFTETIVYLNYYCLLKPWLRSRHFTRSPTKYFNLSTFSVCVNVILSQNIILIEYRNIRAYILVW